MRMITSRARFTIVAAALAAGAAAGRAGDAVTWVDAVAERPVDHGVTVRGPFAAAHEPVTLSGPVAVVSPEPVAEAVACFTVYRIVRPADEPARTVDVAEAGGMRLGPAEFLVVPAKRLADGVADGGGGGVYEARPILAAPRAIDGMPADAGRPTHVCLPVDYRHHFERVAVADEGRGLVLSSAREKDAAAVPAAVADDFGIHRLAPGRTARAGTWVAVRPRDEP